ncbi:ankyrin, partial [Terfezia boudieri ATCC MYA-4762]
ESIVSLLLDRGADANATDGSGRYGTALLVAVFMGKKPIVTMLLSRGADVNTVDSVYGTVLGVAAKTGNADIVSLLLD